MAIVYRASRTGPSTHALIIAVGGYPHIPDIARRSPSHSAFALADWLITRFRNPAAPLASVELLASAPGGAVGYPLPGLPSVVGLEPPTVENVRAAVSGWRSRAADPDSIALFYFVGQGCGRGADTLLMFDDHGSQGGGGVAGFLGLVETMVTCPARQLFLVDASRLDSPVSPPATPLFPSTGIGPTEFPPRAILYAASAGQIAYDLADGPSFFNRALIAALEGAKLPRVTDGLGVRALAQRTDSELQEILGNARGASQKVEAKIDGDFDFHFPTTEGTSLAQPLAAGGGRRAGAPPPPPPPSSRPPRKAAANAARPDPPEPAESAPRRGMTKSEMAAALDEKDAWLPGKRVKLDFGPAGVVMLEGVEGKVTEEDGPADTTIAVAWEDWQAMSDGTLDGMTAFMKGKMKVVGDMSNAMQLQAVLAKLRTPAPPPPPAGRTGRGTAKEAGGDPGAPRRQVREKQPPKPPPPEPPPPKPPPPPPADETNTEFVPDDAETERDELGRSVLAIGLARRLHRIWRSANESPASPLADDERAAFVVHLDAPWGGGKTTFANYLARVLDPLPGGRKPAAFLRERYGEADLGGIFLDDPPADADAAERLAKLPAAARRPWIVIPFNAWQVEHCAPPWWVFYQTIRKGCFDSILKEGDLPWSPEAGRPRLPLLQRLDSWVKLWLREYWWRLANPKVRSLLLTAAVSLVLLLLLQRFGIWGLSEGNDPKAGFVLTSGLGLVLGGLTGVTFLWGLGALFTESIVPGTDTLAERLSLGSGDPFERFRRHFASTIARVRRPVMVVVDDLDRCRPDFVVGLVRGIQTLLRSPRVVFVILGDRDWIERAFEAHHKAMEKVDVGPEQTFGARFVEKAIQMSFILPAMGDEGRLAYVRRVLLGAVPQPRREAPAIDAETAKAVREVVNRETAEPDSDPFDTKRIVSRALEEVGSRPAASAADDAALALQVEQLVGETLAINATSSERVEQAVAHQLETLAAHFPANPRQIKRIVNAITIYYAVALQRPGLNPDEAFRTQLALWIIIMTEWPETWRLLASFPALVPILQSDDPLAAVNAEGADLPGSPEATAKVVRRTLADAELMALIKGSGSAPLDPARVPLLAQLTPLHSRKRRLPESKAAEPEGKEEAA